MVSRRKSLAAVRAAITFLTLFPLAWGLLALTVRGLMGSLQSEALLVVPILGVGVLFGAAALASAIGAPRWHTGIGITYFGGLACMMLALLMADPGSPLAWSLLALAVIGSLAALVVAPKGGAPTPSSPTPSPR